MNLMGDFSRALNAAGLHPSIRILAWGGLAVAATWAAVFGLLAVGLFAMAVAPKPALMRLLARSRWLLVSLVLIFGYGTPGEALAPDLSAMSPTWEGVAAGALHAWRLVFIMATLSLLVNSMAEEDLLSGLYLCLRPLEAAGIPTERFAIRLWLVLQYAQSSERPACLREWLGQDPASAPAACSTLRLAVPGYGPADAVLVAATLALTAALLA